jgi:uncharacterized surface protein with fasciclin (FAS1) repeats
MHVSRHVSGRVARRTRTRWLLVLPLVIVLLATACHGGYRGTIAFTGEPKPTDVPQNIPDVLAADSQQRFTTLLDLIDKAGFGETLEGPGPMTLFAPTNAAFAVAFTPAQLDALKQQTAEAKKLLQGQVTAKDVSFTVPSYVTTATGGGTTALLVDNKTPAADAGLIVVQNPVPLTMLNDNVLTIAPNKTITLPYSTSTASVIDADIQAPNGFIQVVDKVLVAPAGTPTPAT